VSDADIESQLDFVKSCYTPAMQELLSTNNRDKPSDTLFAALDSGQVKRKSIRGAGVALGSQALRFVLQMGTTMILARLLSPEDFGLQGMVLVMTGFLGVFRDAGLGTATVQRDVITHEQISALFWINVGLGSALTVLAVVLAPVFVAFYHEPRLYSATMVSAITFLLIGLGAQHGWLLQREMRFMTMAKIDLLSLAISSAVGITMARWELGYWALVGMIVSGPLVTTAGAWLAVRWLPGMPSRGSGVRSMLHFGGTVSCNTFVVYVGYNVEKILLGRFWGAESLGLYGRANQLASMPSQQFIGAVGGVVFPALSRMQDDNERLCRSFLKGYSVVLSVIVPVVIASAVFAEDIVRVVLGPKWNEAAPVLRFLTPAILGFALMDPFRWFLMASGLASRNLRISYLVVPTMVLGILAGLPYGPKGVAFGYSLAVALLVVPVMAWAIQGTAITKLELWRSVNKPLFAGLVAGACGLICRTLVESVFTPLPRLIVELCLVTALYIGILLIIKGQRRLFLDLIHQLFSRVDRGTE
jgi:O-antigen/teichoic acid export membrane protein